MAELYGLLAPEIPDSLRLSSDQPKGNSQDGKKDRFIGMVPKVFEVFGVDKNEQEGNAELAGDNILCF